MGMTCDSGEVMPHYTFIPPQLFWSGTQYEIHKQFTYANKNIMIRVDVNSEGLRHIHTSESVRKERDK